MHVLCANSGGSNNNNNNTQNSSRLFTSSAANCDCINTFLSFASLPVTTLFSSSLLLCSQQHFNSFHFLSRLSHSSRARVFFSFSSPLFFLSPFVPLHHARSRVSSSVLLCLPAHFHPLFPSVLLLLLLLFLVSVQLCVCVCCCCYFIAITRRSSALKLRLWRKKWLSLSTASRRRLLGHLGKAQISGLGMLEKWYNNYFFNSVLCLLFVDLNLTCQHKQKIIQGFLLKSFFKIATLIWIYIIKILAVSIVLF